jgi:hypothetical protein
MAHAQRSGSSRMRKPAHLASKSGGMTRSTLGVDLFRPYRFQTEKNNNDRNFHGKFHSAAHPNRNRYSSFVLRKAVARHRSLNEWFCRPESSVAAFAPVVVPQGSFRYGTVVRPIVQTQKYDLDNVTTLQIAKTRMSQKELKNLYGTEVRAYAIAHNITRWDIRSDGDLPMAAVSTSGSSTPGSAQSQARGQSALLRMTATRDSSKQTSTPR